MVGCPWFWTALQASPRPRRQGSDFQDTSWSKICARFRRFDWPGAGAQDEPSPRSLGSCLLTSHLPGPFIQRPHDSDEFFYRGIWKPSEPKRKAAPA